MNNTKPSNRQFIVLVFVNAMLFIAVLFLLIRSGSGTDKVAYVESNRLLAEYKGAETARKEFEEKANEWKSNIDTLEQEVRDAMKNHEKGVQRMTSGEQKKSIQLINAKRKQLVEYQKAVSENAKEENSKLMKGVVANINSFLLEYGKENGYKMIFIANESGTIAYAREGLDVTGDVLDELNQKYLGISK